jgi:hypothetical protein
MADAESKWSQNMDKIAYGVAVLLGLVVVAIPAVRSHSGPDELSYQEQALKERIDNQKPLEVVQPPLRLELEKQWTAGSPSPLDPRWVTEVPPVLVRAINKTPEGEAVHAPGSITEIDLKRDKDKESVYLHVKYAPGASNALVVIKKWELLRQADEGAFQPAPGFKASGEHEFKDYQVEPGKKYSYKLVTTAELDPKAPERTKYDEKTARQESAPLGPTEPVPHDFSITISDVPAPKSQDEPIQFLGKLMYWSYKDMKLVDVNGGQVRFFKEKDSFADKRYEFSQIIDSPPKVVIRDMKKNGVKHTFTRDNAKAHRPVKLWEPLVPAKEAEPEEASTATGAAKKGDKGAGGEEAKEPAPEEPKEAKKPAPAATKKSAAGSGERKEKKRSFK